MSNLKAKDKKIYTELFNELDVDNSGTLNMNEVGLLCKELGFDFDSAQLQDVFGQLDRDQDGSVSLGEFLSAMQPIKRSEKRCATLRRMFKRADVNKDGVLTVDELYTALKESADDTHGLDEDDVKRIIAAADKNGDGKLDYEEFLALLKPVIESKEA